MGIALDKMLSADARPRVVLDCSQLVDDEVAAKKGMTGMMIKGGYKAFKAIKPTIVRDAVDHLLDRFVAVIDQQYEEYRGTGGAPAGFEPWAAKRDKQIANALLGVTDDIINRSDKSVIKKIYSGLRGIAEAQVASAVPGVARIVIKYV